MEHPDENILLKLPVKIGYPVVADYLRKTLIGEKIKTENNGEVTYYAEILDLGLYKSQREEYDLSLEIRFKTLTRFLGNKRGSFVLDVSVRFDADTQQLWVRNYYLDGKNNSWLLNASLQTLVNNLIYEKLLGKMKLDLRPLVEEKLQELNSKLADPLEAYSGIFLSIALVDFRVLSVIPGDELLLVFVEIEGRGLVDIKKISF